jgi:26S proteasome regulatory subunit T3
MAEVMQMDETGPVSMDISTPKESKEADDLYKKFKVLQKQLEFLDIQEEYIKDEMKVSICSFFKHFKLFFSNNHNALKNNKQNLKREQIRAKEEITRIQSVPLVIGQFSEMVDENYGIVVSTAGSSYYGTSSHHIRLIYLHTKTVAVTNILSSFFC